MFGVGAQQDMHIPGKEGPTCQQPERKFLARGGGKGAVGVSRCKKGTYTKNKKTKKHRGRSFGKLGPTCPALAFPSIAVRPFSPPGSGVPQLYNSWETCPGWEDRKPHPEAQHSVPEGSHGLPQPGVKAGARGR